MKKVGRLSATSAQRSKAHVAQGVHRLYQIRRQLLVRGLEIEHCFLQPATHLRMLAGGRCGGYPFNIIVNVLQKLAAVAIEFLSA